MTRADICHSSRAGSSKLSTRFSVRPMSAAETGVRRYGLDVGTVPGLRMDGELFNRVTWRHEI
jgi:hypothetical protein